MSKSIFAAIGGRKDRIIFLNDIIKIWKTWVVTNTVRSLDFLC